MPQCAVEVAALTQVTPQRMVPAAQPQRPEAQVCVAGQRVPVPQMGPPGHTFGMGIPHSTVVGDVVGQRGAHSHTKVTGLHAWPVGQSVPRPVQVMPGHELGIIAPHVTADAAGHVGTHSHMLVAVLQR